jgi:dipeptidase
VLLRLAAGLAGAALAASLLGGGTGGGPAPAADGKFRPKCTTILVGKDATSDGSVMLAHNEDLGESAAHHYAVVPRAAHPPGEVLVLWSGARVPQVPVTYAYIATRLFDEGYVPGDVTTGINEYQVAVANNSAVLRGAPQPGPTRGRLIWTDFMRLALERAQTARQAVQVMGDLAQTYRLGVDTATLFAVTDAAEGWWVEIAKEGQWAAQRVPDDGAAMRANTFRIGVVDFGDPERFMHSADLVCYAEARGWYGSADGPFDFTRAYGDRATAEAEWNTHRHERVEALLAASAPAVTVHDLLAILRDHYEGTPYDLTDGYRYGSPHRTDEYTPCSSATVVSVAFQSRGWLPPEIGAVCWRALATPCASPYVPWYLGQIDVPQALRTGTDSSTANSAYWAFRGLASHVDGDYAGRIGAVRDAWREFEAREAAEQITMERRALELYALDPAAARRLLTAFSDTRSVLACQRARSLSAAEGR